MEKKIVNKFGKRTQTGRTHTPTKQKYLSPFCIKKNKRQDKQDKENKLINNLDDDNMTQSNRIGFYIIVHIRDNKGSGNLPLQNNHSRKHP